MHNSLDTCWKCGAEQPLTRGRKTPLSEIANTAAEIWAVDVEAIIGPARSRIFTAPRFAVCSVAYAQGWPMKEIARFLNGRDHTTISSAIQRARTWITEDPDFAVEHAELARFCAPKRPELVRAA